MLKGLHPTLWPVHHILLSVLLPSLPQLLDLQHLFVLHLLEGTDRPLCFSFGLLPYFLLFCLFLLHPVALLCLHRLHFNLLLSLLKQGIRVFQHPQSLCVVGRAVVESGCLCYFFGTIQYHNFIKLTPIKNAHIYFIISIYFMWFMSSLSISVI